jgi:hypothetical protein
MDNKANRLAKTFRARARRAAAKQAGAYDGRFAPRVQNGRKATTARGRVNLSAIMAEYAEGE